MSRSTVKNDKALLKAATGLGLALLAMGAVFFIAGPKDDGTFHIPDSTTESKGETGKTASLSPESFRESAALSSEIRSQAGRESRAAADSSPVAGIDRALELKNAGNWQEAETMLRDEIARNPENVRAYTELAMIQLNEKGDARAASATLESALEVDPHNDLVMEELVSVYDHTGDWNHALGFFDSFIAEGESPQLSYGQGMALLKTGRPEEAIGALNKSIYQDGVKSFAAHEKLAEAYEASGRVEDAIREYDQMTAGNYDPQQMRNARMRMANAYIANGDIDQARKVLQGMISQNPQDEDAAQIMRSLEDPGA